MTILAGSTIDADDITTMGFPPLAMLRQTSAQTFATSGSYAALLFDTEDYDSSGAHSTVSNTSRFTATVAGIYQLDGGVSFASNATGRRLTRWTKNGSVISGGTGGGPANSSVVKYQAGTVLVTLNGTTDYVELQAMQESGGSLATFVATAEFQSTMVVKWVSF